jgi:pheromone shutdown protein TraB
VENPSLQEADVLTQAMKDLAEEFPELMRPLIQERDEYMVFLLRALASR